MAESGFGGRKDGESRQRFGALLDRSLRARSLKQEDLAGELGTTQSSISGWINGKYEPAAGTVFAIERELGLEPGYLSRPLGYLPVEAGSRPVGVDTVIANSALLGEDDKAVLIGLYDLLASKRSRSLGKPRPAQKAAANRARLSATPSTKPPSTSQSLPQTMAGGK